MTHLPSDPCIKPESAIEVVSGVHIIPDPGVPFVPNIGLIEGTQAVLVVDCGLGPANGARVFDWARDLAGARKIYLALTHFHPEHGFGAQAFSGRAEIVVNQLQAAEFHDKAAGYLDMFRGFGAQIANALKDTRLVPPDRIYSGHLELDLGGRVVSLEEIGPAHTRGDQVVWLAKERVLFTGDLAEEGMFPIFPWFPGQDTDLDARRWKRALEALAARGTMTVIPGHGRISDQTLLNTLAGYMAQMLLEVGKSPADVDIAAIEQLFFARYPDWQGREWVAFAARHYSDVARSRL